MLFIKNNYKYFLFFTFICLVFYLDLYLVSGDALNNYGFSYAIIKGEIPYKDFNTVSTPLYSFIMSIGLLINNNYLIFLLEQSVLVTLFYVLLDKIYHKSSLLILSGLFIFLLYAIIPTYNFLALVLFSLLLYLEKNKKCDYLIGLVLGLLILTKHSIGIVLLLPSFYYLIKDSKRFVKRIIGLLMPIIIFVLYLFITKSISSFLDLCIFGMFDFTNNTSSKGIYFVMSLIILFISIIVFIKKKNIINFYFLLSFIFMVPLFDGYHFSIYFLLFLMLLFNNTKINNNIGSVLFISLSIIFILYICLNKSYIIDNRDHFKYMLNYKDRYEYNLLVDSFLDKYSDSIILSYYNMEYNISRNNRIDYYSAFFNGNFGYDGTNKMIKRIKNSNNKYIIINMNNYNSDHDSNQFAYDVAKYVIKNYKKIDEKYNYVVYSKE